MFGYQPQNGEEVNNTLQIFIEALSPQNNRIARWWSRLLLESLNEEQVNIRVFEFLLNF